MKIATYYDSLSEGHKIEDSALIDLWSESWRKRGFETEVLCLRDAKLHPFFGEFFDVVSEYPTLNARNYEVACFVRHLAFHLSDARLFSDYDVINYSMTPEQPELNLNFHSFCCGGPPLFTANKEAMRKLIFCLMNLDRPEMLDGRPHLSDQTVFQSLPISSSHHALDYLEIGWEKALAVHYSNRFWGVRKQGRTNSAIKPV
jgi:hypothetical protein